MQRIPVRNLNRQQVDAKNVKPQKITPVNAAYTSIPAYSGEYEVDPDFTGTVLLTNGKRMEDDVTVNPIEVQRVSNPQGGKTVYIGGIIDG